MEGIRFVDIYATKGIEYLIVIAFLGAVVFFSRYLFRRRPAPAIAPEESGTRFRVPERLFYHQGHAWLRPQSGSIGVVGLDDFAQKLVGRVDSLELPPVGTRLTQGAKAWALVVDSVRIPMLSPANGEVVEVNQEVLRSPGLLQRDPYENGWLLKVKDPAIVSDAHNLLSGKVARAWMESALERLNPIPHTSLGMVLQDGGLPVEGIARVIGGEKWQELARACLLTEEGVAAAPPMFLAEARES
jgi:glycine cleavage system H lipoate-binding protein